MATRIRRDGAGRIFADTRTVDNVLLNPSAHTRTIHQSSNFDERIRRQSLFKLLTVRRLTNLTIEQVRQKLEISRNNLATAALQANQPIPYPGINPVSADDLRNTFGVFIDEDLYGYEPIYSFTSPNSLIKAFIINTGTSKEDYCVHIAHYISSTPNTEGTSDKEWRIISFEYINNLLTTYVLESTSLPECFQKNYSLENIHYIGGGTWYGIAIDPLDIFKIYGRIKFPDSTHRLEPPGSTRGIIYHSVTPSYSFSWCRGQIEVNRRERSVEQLLDTDLLKSSAVIRHKNTSNYKLDLCYRVDPLYIKQEYSSNYAEYVGNTNLAINSPFQSPDYGTDVGRYTIQRYQQETNILRPVKNTWDFSNVQNSSKEFPSLIPVLSADKSMKAFIKFDQGIAKGSINHEFDLKVGIGHREYDHMYFYKYWFAYGQILQTNSIGDTNLYLINRITGNRTVADNFLNKGELKISEYPNAVITTWEAPNPAVFFSPRVGRFEFIFYYLNPPLIGHQGVFYYQINPFLGSIYNYVPDGTFTQGGVESTSDTSGFFGLGGSFMSGDESARGRLMGLQSVYSQMIGGTVGSFVSSLNIGEVNIAKGDLQSRLVRSPIPDIKAELENEPMLFPNSFYDGYQSTTIDNANKGTIIKYDLAGNITESYTF